MPENTPTLDDLKTAAADKHIEFYTLASRLVWHTRDVAKAVRTGASDSLVRTEELEKLANDTMAALDECHASNAAIAWRVEDETKTTGDDAIDVVLMLIGVVIFAGVAGVFVYFAHTVFNVVRLLIHV